MFTFQVYEKALPLKRNLDDVPPGLEKYNLSKADKTQKNKMCNNNQQHHNSPGEETGANHITEYCNTTGGQTHHQRSIVGILRQRDDEKIKRMQLVKLNNKILHESLIYQGSMQLHSIQLQRPCCVKKTQLCLALFKPPGYTQAHTESDI